MDFMLNYINEYCTSIVTDKDLPDKGTRVRIVIISHKKICSYLVNFKIKEKCLNNDTIYLALVNIDNIVIKNKKCTHSRHSQLIKTKVIENVNV